MEAMVLAYNIAGPELKKLKKICAGKSVRVRAVTPEDFTQPVGALCGVEKRLESPAPESGELTEKLLVLTHMTQRQLDSLLTELRTARLCTGALKAVLTPTNAKWSSYKLYAELKRERGSLA